MRKTKAIKKTIKRKNGITLIALVITIIVLLILAGVSISMIAGDNSILQRATDAKINTEEAEIKKRIQLSYLASLSRTNGLDDYNILVEELGKEFGTKGTDWNISNEEENPWVVTVGSVEYEINGDGVKPKEETPTPGLYYAESGDLILTWDELKEPSRNLITISNDGVINNSNFYSSSIIDKEGNALGSAEVKLVIGPDVTTISNLDSSYSNIVEVIIPNTVTEISSNGKIGPQDSLKKVTIGNGITEIPNQCFKSYKKLEKVVLGNNVTKIGVSAFEYCIKLSEINFPNSITEIEVTAFMDCRSLLGDITLPASLSTLGTQAFKRCSSLTNLIINDGLISLGTYTFAGCSSLESVTIPTSVTSIGNGVFNYECTALKDIYYKGTMEQWNSITKGSQNDKLTAATIHENS